MPGCILSLKSLDSRRVWCLGGYSFTGSTELCFALLLLVPLSLALPQTALTLLVGVSPLAPPAAAVPLRQPASTSFIETPGHLERTHLIYTLCSVLVFDRLLQHNHMHT
jgi:hypothetical protein